MLDGTCGPEALNDGGPVQLIDPAHVLGALRQGLGGIRAYIGEQEGAEREAIGRALRLGQESPQCLDQPRELARAREGADPAVAVAGRAAQRCVRGAAHPDREQRLQRPGRDADVLHRVVPPGVAETFVGPQAADDLETLVGPRAALGQGHPHGGVLAGMVATHTDAENHAAAG